MEPGVREQRHLLRVAQLVLALVAATELGLARAQSPKFFPDDPLPREPETRDASAAQPYDLSLTASLMMNLFAPVPRDPSPRAGNVNTIDEVPDSSWFTNRIYARPIDIAEIARGPNVIDGPAPGRWTVVAAKTSGAAPGFRVRDERGEVWFLSLDARGAPRAATGAIAVATRLFWALGYHQIESHLARFHPRDLVIGESATVEPRPRYERPMRMSDIEAVLARAARDDDGTYRVLAARAAPGRILGGFRYQGTRPDDPNDIVPHEHRRELRALKVFAAWTNLVDLKAINTLDTVITENGRQLVRHYLQDVGSAFGTGANGPHDWDEGREYLFEVGPTWRRIVSVGFYLRPWQVAPYYEHPEIGRIEGSSFDPVQWKPRVPILPVHVARDDDTFWAALRVAAFSDELIQAAVEEAKFSDPAATAMLAHALCERRDIIARTYLPRITPLVRFALDEQGTLTFENVAVRAGAMPPPARGYRATWYVFDNATGATALLGESTGSLDERVVAPPGLARLPKPPAYVKVVLSAEEPARPSWRAIDVYFKRIDRAWQLVGVER